MAGIKKNEKSVDRIAADLEKARTKLTDTVSDLEDYLKPGETASRTVQRISKYFVDKDGQVKPERLAIAGVALLGLIGLLTRDRD